MSGRPKRWTKWTTTCFMLYEEFKEVYQMIRELAEREGKGFAEMGAIAMKEYVENHYPGNPQLIIKTWTGEMPLPTRVKLRALKRDLRGLMKKLRKYREIEPRSQAARSVLRRLLNLLEKKAGFFRVHGRRDEELTRLLEEADQLIGEIDEANGLSEAAEK